MQIFTMWKEGINTDIYHVQNTNHVISLKIRPRNFQVSMILEKVEYPKEAPFRNQYANVYTYIYI